MKEMILKKAGQSPRVITVKGDLQSLQNVVGGYIEIVPFFPTVYDNIIFICDEEGKLKGKAVNFVYGHDTIVGDVMFAGRNGDKIINLNETQIKAVMTYFNYNQEAEKQ